MAEETPKTPATEETLSDLDFKITDSTLEFSRRKHQFVFQIPTPRQLGIIGIRARKLRMDDDPTTNGWEDGLGWEAAMLYRAMATFEILLKQTSDRRFLSADAEGKPVCDSSKWDRSLLSDYILEVYEGYNQALDSFRRQVDESGTPA